MGLRAAAADRNAPSAARTETWREAATPPATLAPYGPSDRRSRSSRQRPLWCEPDERLQDLRAGTGKRNARPAVPEGLTLRRTHEDRRRPEPGVFRVRHRGGSDASLQTAGAQVAQHRKLRRP